MIYHTRRPCSFVMGHTSPAASVGPVCYVSLYNSWPIFRKDLFHTWIAQCSVNDSQACVFTSSADLVARLACLGLAARPGGACRSTEPRRAGSFCPAFRLFTNCSGLSVASKRILSRLGNPSKDLRAIFPGSHFAMLLQIGVPLPHSGAVDSLRSGCLTSNAVNLQPTAVSKFARSSDRRFFCTD